MKYVSNPFSIGLLMVVTELVINNVSNLLLGIELSLSSFVIVFLFGFFVVWTKRRMFSRSENLQTVLTYTAIVLLILLLRDTVIDGEEVNGAAVFASVLFLIIASAINYLFFYLGQKVCSSNIVDKHVG